MTLMAWDLNSSFYGNYGLTFQTPYLKAVFPDVVHFSRSDQSEFADAITRRFASHPDFCWLQMMAPECERAMYEQLIAHLEDSRETLTVLLGNAAYMSQHCPPYFRSHYQGSYDAILAYMEDQFPKTDATAIGHVDATQKIHWLHRLVSRGVCAVVNPFRKLSATCSGQAVPVDCGLPY